MGHLAEVVAVAKALQAEPHDVPRTAASATFVIAAAIWRPLAHLVSKLYKFMIILI